MSVPSADSADADMPAFPPWWRRIRWTQTSPREATVAEKGLLSLVQGPGLLATNVPVGPGRSDWLHTVHNRPLPQGAPSPSFTTAGQTAAATHGGPPFVLMPGYGAGVGFFWRNFGPLASAVRLYAVDWLGTGLSGRPRYAAKTREEAEDFFINSLATWRQKAGIENEKMVLVGHSLGGYLSAAYALRHPEHVQHLVLVCPAGVPKAPEDWQKRFLTGQSGVRNSVFNRARARRAAMWAWEAGVTPHSVIRSLGPWGPRICGNYVVRRFAMHGDGLTDKEAASFQQYFYNIIAQPGSGEHALRHLLAPGAFAHVPLVERLKELKVPVTFIYGESDWMRPEHAVELCQNLKKERKPLTSSDLHVEIIKDAGHFAFIDQPDQFNQALLDACSQYLGAPAKGVPVSQDADSTTWGSQTPEPRPAAA